MAMLFWLLAQAIAIILLAFSLRRAVLLIAACLPKPPNHPVIQSPNLLILIPCRDEALSLPALFAALDQLDYPRDKLQAVLVDDGSDDQTVRLAEAWAVARLWAHALPLAKNLGKAQALNQALTPSLAREIGLEGEIIIIYDADHHPAPESLRALVAPFANPAVAAVSGQMRVSNGQASPAAFYTAVESLVNQLITMRGKDRLNLAPAILGSNCAYRRAALDAVGGFRPGALLEDSDLTLAFALAGWRTRFAPESVSEHHAPTSLRGYIKQHLRWNRGFHQVSGGRLASIWANPRLSPLLKLELTFFALGYADRLALVAGALFTTVDLLQPGTFGFPLWVWLVYFGLPALEMLAALSLAHAPADMVARLIYVPLFFLLDIGIALWSSLQTLLGKPFAWSVTERSFTAESAKDAKL